MGVFRDNDPVESFPIRKGSSLGTTAKHFSGAVLPRIQIPDCNHGGSARGLGSLGVLGALGGRSLIVCQEYPVRPSDSGLPCTSAQVENYTVKRSRRSITGCHNGRLIQHHARIPLGRASRSAIGDYLDNRCHRLPQKAPWIKMPFLALWTRVNVTGNILVVVGPLSTASSPCKRPDSNSVRAMLCPDCSIRR